MVFVYVSKNTVAILCKEAIFINAKGTLDDVEELMSPELPPQAKGKQSIKPAKTSECSSEMEKEDLQKEETGNRAPGKTSFLCGGISKCGHFLAATNENKQLLLWRWGSTNSKWELISTREVVRKCIRVQLTHSGESILAADRGGDVYDFSVLHSDQPGKLLLGHLSMLLDLVMTPRDEYVITCDRDEKIRVSHYPNAYNIQTYCLGHKAFITSLCLCGPHQRWLMSGSGDGTIRIWSYEVGTQLHCHRYAQETEKLTQSGAVQRILCNMDNRIVAAIFLSSQQVQLYDMRWDDNPNLIPLQTLTLSLGLWDADFDLNGYLVVLAASERQLLHIYRRTSLDDDKSKFDEINVDETGYKCLNAHLNKYCKLHKKMLEEEKVDYSFLEKQWFDNIQDYMEKKRKREETKKISRSKKTLNSMVAIDTK